MGSFQQIYETFQAPSGRAEAKGHGWGSLSVDLMQEGWLQIPVGTDLRQFHEKFVSRELDQFPNKSIQTNYKVCWNRSERFESQVEGRTLETSS
jgi:hypothetical protein